jgi:hypothetical protein
VATFTLVNMEPTDVKLAIGAENNKQVLAHPVEVDFKKTSSVIDSFQVNSDVEPFVITVHATPGTEINADNHVKLLIPDSQN